MPSKSPRNRKDPVFLGIGLLFAISGIVLTGFGFWSLYQGMQQYDWPNVEGQVIYSEVNRRITGTGGNRYYPDIHFKYVVDGKEYIDRTFAAGPGRKVYPMQSHARQITDRYPTGKKIMLAYNPRKPEMATLDPGPGGGTFALIGLGLPFLIPGSYCTIKMA